MTTKPKLQVLDHEIATTTKDGVEYICITDIARFKNPDRTGVIISNWLRNRNTIEFLGIWEQLNNPDFKVIEFDDFKKQAGLNSFTLTPGQWIEKTGAIGITTKPGRYGGTFAQKDIAFEFASWISVEFKLYLIKETQRLVQLEHPQRGLDIRQMRVLIENGIAQLAMQDKKYDDSNRIIRMQIPNSQLITYQTEDGGTRLGVRLENETDWLSQKRMACLEGEP